MLAINCDKFLLFLRINDAVVNFSGANFTRLFCTELTIHILLHSTINNNSIANCRRHFETDKKIKTLIHVSIHRINKEDDVFPLSSELVQPFHPRLQRKQQMETFLSSLLVYFLSVWQV